MSRRWGSTTRIIIGIALAVAGVVVLRAPERAPAWVFLALLSTAWPLLKAAREARGTALGSAVVWAAVAVVLALIAQATAWREPISGGRPAAGHWAYVSSLATLSALISVLNARRPGGGAWAFLMSLLILVFLIPWLEGAGLSREVQGWARLRLESPWTLFYALLVLAGATNYLPTRFGLASAWVGLALVLEYLGLTRTTWPLERRGSLWSAAPWCLAVALWAAEFRSRRGPIGGSGLERLWFWFRDRWGVVWALRVQERFNRSASASGWPIRLTWHGVVPSGGRADGPVGEIPEAAEATLRGLLRRFADPGRIDRAAGG